MENKTSQSGFTLIELIAVMVILGILAAVLIPRMTSVSESAYEVNAKQMYSALESHLYMQSQQAAITGAHGVESFPVPNSATANNYLDDWIKDYDADKWKQTFVGATSGRNPNNVVGSNPGAIIFEYHPHGVGVDVKKDVWFIEYFPATSASAKADNYDYDTFSLIAYKDDNDGGADGSDQDCNLLFDVTAGSGDVAVENMYLAAPPTGVDTRLPFVANPQP